MADYWFTLDESVIAANDHDISMTFSSGGSPVDVTAWANMTYKAESDTLTDTITVANDAMVKSDSGSGTTDTVTIPLASTDTDIAAGRYSQEFSAEISSKDRTIFRGTIRIVAKIAEVP